MTNQTEKPNTPMQPELFTSDGHLTDLAFRLLMEEKLDQLQSLEVSEHLSFCDRCLERYTSLLCGEAALPQEDTELPFCPPPLMEAPELLSQSIMHEIRRKERVFYLKKGSSLAAAACLTLVLWTGGIFSGTNLSSTVNSMLDKVQSSSQTILEHTNDISQGIDDFFRSVQSSLFRQGQR